jgi:hypothetical protein
MNTKLLHGLKGEDRARTKERFRNNKDIFDRIISLLNEDIELSLRDMRAVVNYDKAAYSEFVADQLGYQRALARYVAILTLDQEDNHD